MGKREQIEAATAIYKEAFAAIERADTMIEAGTGAVIYRAVAAHEVFDGHITVILHHGLDEIAKECGEAVSFGETSIGSSVRTICIGDLRIVEHM